MAKTSNQNIHICEKAPHIFRKIREKYLPEETLFQCFKPIENFEAIHNFSPGQGKSPSFFFFSDNKKLIAKTLK